MTAATTESAPVGLSVLRGYVRVRGAGLTRQRGISCAGTATDLLRDGYLLQRGHGALRFPIRFVDMDVRRPQDDQPSSVGLGDSPETKDMWWDVTLVVQGTVWMLGHSKDYTLPIDRVYPVTVTLHITDNDHARTGDYYAITEIEGE